MECQGHFHGLVHQHDATEIKGVDTLEKWMSGAAKRFHKQFGERIGGDDPTLFVDGLIAHGLYREISIGGKVY